MQGDAVPPEGAAGLEQARAQGAGQLRERSPAGAGDLLPIARGEFFVLGGREEDVRPPGHLVGLVEEARLSRDEIPLQLDLEARLLERLAAYASSKSSPALIPPPGGRQTPGSKCGLRISASRSPLKMKTVTSCIRSGL